MIVSSKNSANHRNLGTCASIYWVIQRYHGVYALRCFVEFKLGSIKSFALDRAALLFVK